jgi:hypothetical protein
MSKTTEGDVNDLMTADAKQLYNMRMRKTSQHRYFQLNLALRILIEVRHHLLDSCRCPSVLYTHVEIHEPRLEVKQAQDGQIHVFVYLPAIHVSCRATTDELTNRKLIPRDLERPALRPFTPTVAAPSVFLSVLFASPFTFPFFLGGGGTRDHEQCRGTKRKKLA